MHVWRQWRRPGFRIQPDGVFVPLITGMAVDAPKHIASYQNSCSCRFLVEASKTRRWLSLWMVCGNWSIRDRHRRRDYRLVNTIAYLVVFGVNSVYELSGNTTANFV